MAGDKLRLVGRESAIKDNFKQNIEHDFFSKYMRFQRKHHILVFKWPFKEELREKSSIYGAPNGSQALGWGLSQPFFHLILKWQWAT